MSILVLAEHNNQEIKDVTANTLDAAKQLAEKSGLAIHVLVAGHECTEVANKCASINGVDSVIAIDNAALTHQLSENLAPMIAKVVTDKSVTHLMASATTQGKSVMPRAAALLDVAQISEIVEIVSDDTFIRPIYAGNALATVQSSDKVKVITVRGSAFDEIDMNAGDASPIETITEGEDLQLSTFIGEELSVSERPELTSARVIISGGRGLKSGDNFPMLERVADKLGAAVGASRAAVDAGYVPNEMQVGQTGKIVSPDLYIAVGISGAIQHLAGMKESKVIVAINNDSEAPIFNVADYGLVADLFEVLPELEAELG